MLAALPISRRLIGVMACGIAAMATLAACDKPTPGVTVFSGTHSDHTEAICWSSDADRAVNRTDCSISPTTDNASEVVDQIPTITAEPGATVGISVDPAVAENGWIVSINSRALIREPITEKYFKFTMPPQALRQGPAQLIVQALTTSGNEIRGSWAFTVDNDAS